MGKAIAEATKNAARSLTSKLLPCWWDRVYIYVWPIKAAAGTCSRLDHSCFEFLEMIKSCHCHQLVFKCFFGCKSLSYGLFASNVCEHLAKMLINRYIMKLPCPVIIDRRKATICMSFNCSVARWSWLANRFDTENTINTFQSMLSTYLLAKLWIKNPSATSWSELSTPGSTEN